MRYFEEIIPIVKYAEDLTVRLMIAGGEKVEYLDTEMHGCQGLLWYEYGFGISTSGNPRWRGLYRDDSKNVFCLIREKGLIPRWLYEWHFHRERMKSTKKRFIRLMLDPASFVQRFIPRKRSVGLKGWGEAACDLDGLKRILDA